MKSRSLLLIGTLALASLASAKSYDIVLSEPSMAGSVTLKPGTYRLKVEGNSAVFTNTEDGKKFTAPVKIEDNGTKHEQTSVESDTSTGVTKVKSIELGGSHETLEFGD